jgi:hypothetical protein
VRGAASLLADALATARRAGTRFSVTARQTATVTRAITTIPKQAWVAIRYPNAIWDHEQQRWISDAEVAQTTLTAFTVAATRSTSPPG